MTLRFSAPSGVCVSNVFSPSRAQEKNVRSPSAKRGGGWNDASVSDVF